MTKKKQAIEFIEERLHELEYELLTFKGDTDDYRTLDRHNESLSNGYHFALEVLQRPHDFPMYVKKALQLESDVFEEEIKLQTDPLAIEDMFLQGQAIRQVLLFMKHI